MPVNSDAHFSLVNISEPQDMRNFGAAKTVCVDVYSETETMTLLRLT